MAKLDGRVLTFTLLVSLVAPLIFGLFPALRASASGPEAALRDGRSGDGGRSGKRARATLVTVQVSLALTLMVVASLFTRTVINLQARPLGVDAQGLLTARIDLPEAGYKDTEARRIFFSQAREATEAAVSSDRVELTSALPGVDAGRRRSFVVEGREVMEGRAQPAGLLVTVSTGYFDFMGLRVEKGRGFAESDDGTSFPVAVVSRATAERYWPGSSPVGQRIQVSGEKAWTEIVGVVSDVRNLADSKQGAPNIYLPFTQDARTGMYMVTRTDEALGVVARAVRNAIRGVDADQPVDAIRTLKRAIYENDASTNALLTLFVTFAVFALVMAAIGIYGVMAYSVSQRRTEIGLRMALGAERGNVRWMIVSQGARLLAVGVGVGLVAAFALARMLGGLVFGISTSDPLTFVGVPIILVVVALVANLVPARRATSLDPAVTLRAD
jgi:putative ABC transport system permease protein